MQPYPQAKSVLVMDGASIHKGEKVYDLEIRLNRLFPNSKVFYEGKGIQTKVPMAQFNPAFEEITQQDCMNFILHVTNNVLIVRLTIYWTKNLRD